MFRGDRLKKLVGERGMLRVNMGFGRLGCVIFIGGDDVVFGIE
jgi:hypothetical protein